jgi:hypothetical protein
VIPAIKFGAHQRWRHFPESLCICKFQTTNAYTIDLQGISFDRMIVPLKVVVANHIKPLRTSKDVL